MDFGQFVAYVINVGLLTRLSVDVLSGVKMAGNTCGGGRVSCGQPRLPPQGAGPLCPQFCGFSSMRTSFHAERPSLMR